MLNIKYEGHMGPAEEIAAFLNHYETERGQWDRFMIKEVATASCLNGDISIVISILREKYEEDQKEQWGSEPINLSPSPSDVEYPDPSPEVPQGESG